MILAGACWWGGGAKIVAVGGWRRGSKEGRFQYNNYTLLIWQGYFVPRPNVVKSSYNPHLAGLILRFRHFFGICI